MTEDSGKKPVSVKTPLDPISLALRDEGLQKLYANGFALGLTNADGHIVLQLYGRPVAVVNMSYTLLKTLSQRLQDVVKSWEAKTGQTLQTTDMIEVAFKDDIQKKIDGSQP